MKGFPKTIATKADLLNCLAMAQATPPAFPVSELAAAIEQIEAGAYLHCPILGVDGTTVTIGYCAEAAAGHTTGNGAKITAVEHIEEDDATGTKQLTKTAVTLAKALPSDTETLLIPAPSTAAQRMGLTAAELKNIKGVVMSL